MYVCFAGCSAKWRACCEAYARSYEAAGEGASPPPPPRSVGGGGGVRPPPGDVFEDDFSADVTNCMKGLAFSAVPPPTSLSDVGGDARMAMKDLTNKFSTSVFMKRYLEAAAPEQWRDLKRDVWEPTERLGNPWRPQVGGAGLGCKKVRRAFSQPAASLIQFVCATEQDENGFLCEMD